MDLTQLVRRFGRDAEQAAVLTGRWRVFRGGSAAGGLPYRLRFGTALCAGAPLCDPPDTAALLDVFLAACAARRWHAVFVPVGPSFAALAAEHGCAGWKIGEQPILDLRHWPPRGRAAANLRTARNRAAREGVQTREWLPDAEPGCLHELRRLWAAWLAAHGGAPLGFVLGGDPFAPAAGRRWFLAEQNGTVQAVVVTALLPARGAVALQHFMRRPDAPIGCVESAVAAALLAHRAAGVATGLLALAPLRGLDQTRPGEPLIVGRDDRGHRTALRSLIWLRAHGRRLYRAAALERFKRNLAPSGWESAYLVHYPPRLQPRMAVAALQEVLPGGLRSLPRHAARGVGRMLAERVGGR